MKKTIGLMALLISAATALVPAAMARDWDDHFGNQDRDRYTYQAEVHRNNEHARHDAQVRDRRPEVRSNHERVDVRR